MLQCDILFNILFAYCNSDRVAALPFHRGGLSHFCGFADALTDRDGVSVSETCLMMSPQPGVRQKPESRQNRTEWSIPLACCGVFRGVFPIHCMGAINFSDCTRSVHVLLFTPRINLSLYFRLPTAIIGCARREGKKNFPTHCTQTSYRGSKLMSSSAMAQSEMKFWTFLCSSCVCTR